VNAVFADTFFYLALLDERDRSHGQEQPAENRLRALLAAAFGAEWSAAKESELLAQAGYAGKSMEDCPAQRSECELEKGPWH
jgi:hypothetical protein